MTLCGRAGSAAGPGAERLSQSSGATDRRLPCGLVGGHHRAGAGAAHGPDSRPAIRDREQAGCGLESRRRIRRARSEGRLHAVHRHRQPTSPTPRSIPTCRSTSPRISRRSRSSTTAAVILVVPPVDGGEQRAGTDRARQVEARRDPLRLDRRRYRAASVGRASEHARRRQARARALPGLARKPRPTCSPAGCQMMFSPASAVVSQIEAGSAQGARLGGRRSVRASCRTCRPWRKPACRISTPRSGSV